MFSIYLHHAKLVMLALIAPELVIMWAMREWLTARKFAKEHQRKFFISW